MLASSAVTPRSPQLGSTTQSDSDVVAAYLAGDRRAFDVLVDRYQRRLLNFVYRTIGDRERAEDLVQEVFIRVHRHLHRFDQSKKFSTWIYTIARRTAADHARSEKTFSMRFVRGYFNQEDIEPPVSADPDKELWVKQTCDKCVTAMLHCVDNETRLAHIFRDVAELEYAEIAGILEKDEVAVRQMVSRSRKRINSFLRGRCTIYNPRGDCRCRIKKAVDEVDLAAEYEKINDMVRRVNFYKKSETILPSKNYWENLL